MTVASTDLEAQPERSSSYAGFRVKDATGKHVGEAGSLFLVSGIPSYVEVELRGIVRRRHRIVPWELVTLYPTYKEISLRCGKRDLETAPDFDPKGRLEEEGRQARTHFDLPAEPPDHGMLDEPASESADPARQPQVDDSDLAFPEEEGRERSVAEDLQAKTEAIAAAHKGVPVESASELEEDKEEIVVSQTQSGESVPVATENVDELRDEVDEARRMRRPGAEEQDAFRVGATSFDGWHPTFDVSELDDGYRVAIDVPGVEADALELTLEANVLTVSGERPAFLEGELQRRESPTGPFRCRFQLPPHTNADAIEAELRNGVLDVRIPRSVAPEARRITLRGAERGTSAHAE